MVIMDEELKKKYRSYYEEGKKKSIAKEFLILGVILAVLLAVWIFYQPSTTPTGPVCGNGIVEELENCWDCPVDVKCASNEYCSQDTKECIAPVCGNGQCESFESPEICCDDCPCTIPGEICDSATNQCEMQEVEISDEEINELVTAYFEAQNTTISSIEIFDIMTYKDKLGKKVRVELSEPEGISWVMVTEDGDVIELPTF